MPIKSILKKQEMVPLAQVPVQQEQSYDRGAYTYKLLLQVLDWG